METEQINQSKREQSSILNNILSNQELTNTKFNVCVQEKRMEGTEPALKILIYEKKNNSALEDDALPTIVEYTQVM